MLGLVRHALACPRFSKIIKQQCLSYFVHLLHVVTHQWKLQCHHVILLGYGLACLKFSEATNHQCLWKGLCDFVDFGSSYLHLLDIHWIYKNMLFWAGIVSQRLSTNQIVRCFKLKELKKRYEVSSWFFASLKLEEILCYFGLWSQNTLGQSFCRVFYFWLFWLFKLNTGGPLLHCTCLLFPSFQKCAIPSSPLKNIKHL